MDRKNSLAIMVSCKSLYISINIKKAYKLNQKNLSVEKRDLLTQRHKRRQIKLLNLWSMHLYKCQSHNL